MLAFLRARVPALPPALFDLAGAHHLTASGALHLANIVLVAEARGAGRGGRGTSSSAAPSSSACDRQAASATNAAPNPLAP